MWAGVVAPADEIGGRYCENCHVGNIVPDGVTISAISEGLRGYALDPNTAEALWKKSEELVGETFQRFNFSTLRIRVESTRDTFGRTGTSRFTFSFQFSNTPEPSATVA